MRNIKKTVLASVAAIGVSAALIGGATLALFTSNAGVDLTITSGKVNVTAEVLEDSIQYYTMDQATETEKEDGWLGGSEGSYADGKFNLNNITPGAGLSFQLKITNNSTVDIKYQFKLTGENLSESEYNLIDAFKVVAENDGEAIPFINTGSEIATAWTAIAAGTQEDLGTYDVDIYLPWSTGKNYQDLKCSLSIGVYAVQGNAAVENPIDTETVLARLKERAEWTKSSGNYSDYVKSLEIETAEELIVFGTSGTSWYHPVNNPRDNVTTVKITKNIDFTNYDWTPLEVGDVIFDGQGHTISNINMKTPAMWAGFVTYAFNTAFENLTFENVSVSGAQVGVLAGGISGSAYTKIENVTLKGNISVTYVKDEGEDWTGIGAFVGVIREGTIKVSDCKIADDANLTLNVGNVEEDSNHPFSKTYNLLFGYCYNNGTYADAESAPTQSSASAEVVGGQKATITTDDGKLTVTIPADMTEDGTWTVSCEALKKDDFRFEDCDTTGLNVQFYQVSVNCEDYFMIWADDAYSVSMFIGRYLNADSIKVYQPTSSGKLYQLSKDAKYDAMTGFITFDVVGSRQTGAFMIVFDGELDSQYVENNNGGDFEDLDDDFIF